jgi:hypothetical protein
MQDFPQMGNSNPQVMVEHKMEGGVKITSRLQGGATHENSGLTDDLEAE